MFSQKIVANKGSYGIDSEKKIIIWHQSNIDSINKTKTTITEFELNKSSYTLNNPDKQLSYSNTYTLKNTADTYTFYISKLPLIKLEVDTTTITNKYKIPGSLSYYYENKHISNMVGIRHRGNLSLSFPKQSFDLEFWTDSISKETKKIKFDKMRTDDDWILDGLYNEPLRLRSFIATDLWSKIHKAYYIDREPEAKSGFDVKFVDVFKNDTYYGVYALSESINRKQLRLKKHIETTIYGELYKADSYKGAPGFTKVPDNYDNLFPHWGGFQMRYPIIDAKANWKNVSQFVELVVKSSDEEFLKTIEQQVHIPNVIDYYLFLNMMCAWDNLGKNYYLGKYDKNEPYFFIPWDLDGVLGVIREGNRVPKTDEILGNGLFDRLLKLNPNGYRKKVKNRWMELRTKAFSNEEMLKSVDQVYTKFTAQKIYEREFKKWQNELNKLPNEAHYNYLKTWITDRLNYLDTHFKTL